MYKYLVGAFGFVTSATVASGLTERWLDRGAAPRTEVRTMEDVLAEQAREHNKRRGEKIGGATFAGASVYGRTLVVEFTMSPAPTRFDVNASTERLLKQMTDKFCIRKYHASLRQGAAIVYRYQTEGGRVLVDAKVDATICRVPV